MDVELNMNERNKSVRRAQMSGRVPFEFRRRVVAYCEWQGVAVGELMMQALSPIVTPTTPTRTKSATEDTNNET